MKNVFQIKNVVLLASLLFLLPNHLLSGNDTDKLIKKIQKKYETIEDASIKFTQQFLFGVTKNEQMFEGTFLMKKGNKYILELQHQKIITNGDIVWSINNLNKQVIIDKYRDDPNSFLPDKILVSVPQNYYVSLLSNEKIDNQDFSVFKFIPKDKKVNYKWIKVWVSDDLLMKKIQLLDDSSNLTTYIVKEIKINQKIPDVQFQYNPPPDLEVIDLRQ